MTRIKSHFLFYTLFCTVTFVSFFTQAQSTFEQDFRDGVTAYQAKEFTQAVELLTKANEAQKDNVSVLTNLGLAQYQLGNEGLAIAYWRKALQKDPDFYPAQSGLRYALEKIPVKEIPHEIETWENLRTYLLAPVSLLVYLILSALFLFAGGWLLITYGGKRKTSLAEEAAPPTFPTLGVIFSLAFVFTSFLAFLKIYDSKIARGTVIVEKISTQAAPGEGQAALFDLYEGLEVKIASQSGDWVQVTYPGALTGWIPKSALMQTSGNPLD